MKTTTTTTHPSLRSQGWTDAQVHGFIDTYLFPAIAVVLVLAILRGISR